MLDRYRCLVLGPALRGRHRRLAASLVLLGAAPLVAAAAPPPSASAVAGAQLEPSTLDTVEVTGSRLRQRADIASIVPVQSFSAEDLQRFGVATLEDVARVIPQFGISTGGDAWTTLVGQGPSPGLANRTTFGIGGLNMLSGNLGGVTLVLVNGRRLSASGQAFSGSGNLEGFDLSGIPFEAIERIDILPGGASSIYGAEALSGVINIVLKPIDYAQSSVSLRYDHPVDGGGTVKQVNASTSWRSGDWSVRVAAGYEEGEALPRRERWYLASDDRTHFGGLYDNRPSSLGAVWSADGGALPGLTGRLAAIPAGSQGEADAVAFAAAAAPAFYDGGQYLDAISPWRGKSALLTVAYAPAPWLDLHADLRLNETITTDTSYPRIGTYYSSYRSPSSTLRVPAGSGGNPYASDVLLNKVFTDLPQRATTTARNPAASFGASGDFGANARWHYDASLSWARSEQIYRAGGTFDQRARDALYAALLAGDGPIVIYDSASGNPNPPGVLESYLSYDWNTERTDTYTANASVSGRLLRLPAGDVQVVAGLEYLESRAQFDASPNSSYSDFQLDGTISRDNRAVFAEIQLPLLSAAQRLPWVNDLQLNLSARRDDYNDVGSAVSPRYALLYRPLPWITVRGSRSEGFKPPSLWDLYAPYYDFGGVTFSGARYQLYDPVRGEAVGTIGSFQVGHTDLQPTTSVSHNLGLVLEPPFVPGLTLSADYTRTRIENAIGSLEYQQIIDDFPERVVRDSDGRIAMLDDSRANLASALSKTLNWNLGYRLGTDSYGEFLFNASYSRPISTETQATANSVPRRPQQPKRVSGALAWRRGALDLSLAATWQGEFNLYPERVLDYTYESYLELTPRIGYLLPPWLGGISASLSIVNVLNEEPSWKAAGSGYLAQDSRGRRWALELRKTF